MERNCYYAVETSDGLTHHGVKGMRWGMHIFGKDRVPTTGQRRKQKTFADYDKRSSSTSNMDDNALQRYVSRKQQESNFKRAVIPDHSEEGSKVIKGTKTASGIGKYVGWGLTTTGKVLGNKGLQSAGKLVSNLSGKTDNLANAFSKTDEHAQKRARRKLDLSDVSDQDLQRVINRKNLESQYNTLKNDNVVSGKEYVDSVQSYVNLAIGTTSEVKKYRKDPIAYLDGDKKKQQPRQTNQQQSPNPSKPKQTNQQQKPRQKQPTAPKKKPKRLPSPWGH